MITVVLIALSLSDCWPAALITGRLKIQILPLARRCARREVTAYEPPERSSVKSISGLAPFTGSYALEPRDGSTSIRPEKP
jgi:hypothetical protein